MNTHIYKAQKDKRQSVANEVSQKQSVGADTFQFADNRPEAIQMGKLQEMADSSPQQKQLIAYQEMASNSSQTKQAAQLQAMVNSHAARQQQPIHQKENKTGLPDNLKLGIENLSGYSMDDVKVHYSSDKPAQLYAHAYAQGTDIHVVSEQEKHLPHEAWHVVQQKQGRVKPTMQMKGDVAINDDAGLEKEADLMGRVALKGVIFPGVETAQKKESQVTGILPVVQRTMWKWNGHQWEKQDEDEPQTRAPERDGYYTGEHVDTGEVVEEEEEPADPYSGQEVLDNGTTIDYDALDSVMAEVDIGTQVAPAVWRKMRQDLSTAIILENKSHPAHGSNFNKKQRPEQQIKDWANVISGQLKEKLTSYFSEKHDLDL